ncbi:MAG: ABC transporter ATP-binding protein [Lentisphaeria bacterium]|nr:ABC transporter ATP-binding protein [Lentisphaeria bacterium]
MTDILSVRDLTVRFFTYYGVVHAVNGVSFSVLPEETLGIVGESGSGKSVTALSIMGLVEKPGYVTGGSIQLGERSLLKLSAKEWLDVRGREITMCFQNPMRALNPLMKIGYQLMRIHQAHQSSSKHDAARRAVALLKQVNIADAEQLMDRYPHQLSGGMSQRVMVVMALICGPRLLILDEPTTGLDVTVQQQLLNLLRELRTSTSASQMIITHDLGVVANICDRVVVMYGGRVMETAPVEVLYGSPKHPYTTALLQAIPQVDAKTDLTPIPGSVPEPLNMPTGCPFHPRCAHAMPRCSEVVPALVPLAERHEVACHLLTKGDDHVNFD